MLKSNCPQCGAPLEFKFSQAVQTTCPYCRAIIVRHDVNLEKVAEMSDIPQDASPIQITTEGIYNNKAFYVAGRIVYEWQDGGWNEWHLAFQDGTSGWLSDAQAEYAVSFPVKNPSALPPAHNIVRGQNIRIENTDMTVTTVTRARYAGTEGELPFEYWDKTELTFVDLRSPSSHFATIDYSEDPPLLFHGQMVDFDSLKLRNLRQFEGW